MDLSIVIVVKIDAHVTLGLARRTHSRNSLLSLPPSLWICPVHLVHTVSSYSTCALHFQLRNTNTKGIFQST